MMQLVGTWLGRVEEDAESQCLDTFNNLSLKATMLERWLDTFHVLDGATLSDSSGGGIPGTQTCWNSARAVVNVPP